MRFNSSLVCIFIALVATSLAAAEPDVRTAGAISQLSTAMQAPPSVNAATGFVRNARFVPGSVADGAPTKLDKAEVFLLRHGGAFGIDVPALQLEPQPESADALGNVHFTYHQVFRGVPVFGGRLGLHFDGEDNLIAANGSIVPVPNAVSGRPELSSEQARSIARLVVAKHHGIDGRSLDVSTPELIVFNDGVIWGRSGQAHLSWRLDVADSDHVHEELFLDAMTGAVLERIDRIEHISRTIFENDAGNQIWQEGDPLPYSGSGAGRDGEINNLIAVADQTYRTYSNLSGGQFLSWSGTDSSMRHFYDRNGMDCPNAYFNGSSTSFCVGTATDDIIAHEWSHGYTQSTHGLVYAWQSGALNEAYSDIFGETVDLLYDQGNDNDAGVREPGVCNTPNYVPQPELTIAEPASLAGVIETGSAVFNPAGPWTVTAELEEADDGTGTVTDGCEELVEFTPGKIALMTMGHCSDRFVTAVLNAEAGGAAAAIIINTLNDTLINMTGSTTTSIPAVIVGKSDGEALRAALDEPVVATLQLGDTGGESMRWMIGENSSAFGGAIRDMWNPECLGDPGFVSSSNYYCGEGDNGGVHTNSGVGNQAYALVVDGGTLNGVEVPGIGLTRAANIYWRAMSVYQLPLSDFLDHADALAAACNDLAGAPIPDLRTGEVSAEVITAAHCAAVETAMTATEMRVWPSHCNFDTILHPEAPQQPATLVVFDETFDAAPADWKLSNDGVYDEYVARDWVWTEVVPNGGNGGAFFAADEPGLGNCRAGSDDQSGVVHLDSPAITLPMGVRPVVLFDHYIATEKRVDGGNLKISVNGGPFTVVPSSAFLFNPYNNELRGPEWNDNPMAGEEAFVGTNETTYRGSWGQSQVHLGDLAGGGDTIVLRFDFGTDGCGGQDGWYVDNVKVVMEPRARGGAGRVTP